MGLFQDPEYYAILCKRLAALLDAPFTSNEYSNHVMALQARVIDHMVKHDDYDVNDIEEARQDVQDDQILRHRDPDRERSYEDHLESFAPVEHAGDSWKDNEDL